MPPPKRYCSERNVKFGRRRAQAVGRGSPTPCLVAATDVQHVRTRKLTARFAKLDVLISSLGGSAPPHQRSTISAEVVWSRMCLPSPPCLLPLALRALSAAVPFQHSRHLTSLARAPATKGTTVLRSPLSGRSLALLGSPTVRTISRDSPAALGFPLVEYLPKMCLA